MPKFSLSKIIFAVSNFKLMGKVTFFLHYNSEIREKIKNNPDYFKDKKNKVPIYVQVTFSGKRYRETTGKVTYKDNRYRETTGIHINPNNWGSDKKTILAKERNCVEYNKLLKEIEARILNIQTKATHEEIKFSLAYLKKNLKTKDNDQDKQNDEQFFFQCFDEFISTSINKGKATLKEYNNTLKHLKSFSEAYNISICFEILDNNFYDKLLNYFFKDEEISTQTAGKHVKNLKAFLAWCTAKNYNTNEAFKKFKGYNKEKQTIIYLEKSELKKLFNTKLTCERLTRALDLFLFGCFTGLRYSDIQNLDKATITKDGIYFTVIKTKQPQYTPLNNLAKTILKKYKNKLPELSLTNYNLYIKEVGKIAKLTRDVTKVNFIGSKRKDTTKPLYNWLSTHVAKKTYISLFFRGGGTPDTIMKTTGNSDKRTLYNNYLDIMHKDVKRESDKVFNNLKF